MSLVTKKTALASGRLLSEPTAWVEDAVAGDALKPSPEAAEQNVEAMAAELRKYKHLHALSLQEAAHYDAIAQENTRLKRCLMTSLAESGDKPCNASQNAATTPAKSEPFLRDNPCKKRRKEERWFNGIYKGLGASDDLY